MSSVIIVTDKQGRRYAYRSASYWNKEKGAPRTHKEYLGRVDEEGNIIPKKVASENTTADVQQMSQKQNSLSGSEAIALLKQINGRLERIEAAISVLSTAWKSMDSIVGLNA